MEEIMQIDQYGFEAVSAFFKSRQLQTHRVKTIAGATYVCFGDEPVRPIHRIARNPENGETVVEWAYGAWEDAENLEYIPINQTREV